MTHYHRPSTWARPTYEGGRVFGTPTCECGLILESRRWPDGVKVVEQQVPMMHVVPEPGESIEEAVDRTLAGLGKPEGS